MCNIREKDKTNNKIKVTAKCVARTKQQQQNYIIIMITIQWLSYPI